ncbi:hypothetical protein AZA_17585 [Nitrospirillum viridazoti Y2]|nr:hypothetical protein AZA_17585 [Nitrospirillum amazonense Y2]
MCGFWSAWVFQRNGAERGGAMPQARCRQTFRWEERRSRNQPGQGRRQGLTKRG